MDAAEADFQSAVQHAIRAGELLIEAKRQLKHGQWLWWLRKNFPGSDRMARNYMRLARNGNAVADLPTIGEALDALATPKPESDEPPEQDPEQAPEQYTVPAAEQYMSAERAAEQAAVDEARHGKGDPYRIPPRDPRLSNPNPVEKPHPRRRGRRRRAVGDRVPVLRLGPLRAGGRHRG